LNKLIAYKPGQTAVYHPMLERKLVLKPLQVHPPDLPADFVTSAWEDGLRDAVRASYGCDGSIDSSRMNLEETYRTVETICRNHRQLELFDLLKEEVANHIFSIVKSVACREVEVSNVEEATAYLRLVQDAWKRHLRDLGLVRNIFLALDNFLTAAGGSFHTDEKDSSRTRKNLPIGLREMGLGMLKRDMCDSSYNKDSVIARACSCLLTCIEQDRSEGLSEESRWTLYGDVVVMIRSLDMYKEMFEGPFEKATNDYYEEESSSKIDILSTEEYLNYVEDVWKKERSLNDACKLHPHTWQDTDKILRDQLLVMHSASLTSKDRLLELMDAKPEPKIDATKTLLRFCETVHVTSELKSAWSYAIRRIGEDLMKKYLAYNTLAEGVGLIKDLLSLKETLDSMLSDTFEDSELTVAFRMSAKEAFEAFMNGCEQVNKPAHLLAKYCDDSIGSYVRNMKNALTAEEVEARMDSVMTLFRFISAKDIFEAHYKNDLGRRLLNAHTTRGTDEPLTDHSSYRGNEMEKLMLTKLRKECGGGFTSKLEGMYKDMDLSCGLNKEFAEKRKQQQEGNREEPQFEAMVLTSGIWPSYPQWPKNVPTLPSSISSLQQRFSQFYVSKHSGRTLTWMPSLGGAVVRYTTGTRSSVKDLVLSAGQAIVLTEVFNTDTSATAMKISEVTGLPMEEMRRIMFPIVYKVRILKRSSGGPEDKQVDPTETYSLSSDFQDKRRRIVVPQMAVRDEKAEVRVTESRVNEDRQFLLDAALVRIMKSKKTLSHNSLVAEALKECSATFTAEIGEVKKRTFARHIPEEVLVKLSQSNAMQRLESDGVTGKVHKLRVEGPSSWFLVTLRDVSTSSALLPSKLITGIGMRPPGRCTITLRPAADVGYLIDLMAVRDVLGEGLYYLVISRIVLSKAASLPVTSLMPMGLLGKGTFGAVKRVKLLHGGESEDMSVEMALKCVKKAKRGRALKILERERDLLKKVDHPCIVRQAATMQDEKYVYFLLECCAGGDLHSCMRRIGLFSFEAGKFVAGSVHSALHHLHESHRMIFRDLKPENLLVDTRGYIKLADFGTAKKFDKGAPSRTYSLVGTPHYMAPEVVLGLAYSYEYDYWSLGVILFECMFGPKPFGEEFHDSEHLQIFHTIACADQRPLSIKHLATPQLNEDERMLSQKTISAMLTYDPKARRGKVKQILEFGMMAGYDPARIWCRSFVSPLITALDNGT
ncbi:Cullin-4A, partial [Perkinsus chesapeaki]